MFLKYLLFVVFTELELETISFEKKETETLKLVQIVYRHGDRTPTKIIPGDKYDITFWPEGLGQLMNRGKERLYRKGQFLKNRYSKFLKSPRQVYSRSGAAERCLASSAYLLSGLLPPEDHWKWSRGLGELWQAIPIETIPKELDELLEFNYGSCPLVDVISKEIEASIDCQKNLNQFNDLFQTITAHFDVEINSTLDARFIASTLLVEKENGFLQDWLNKSDYDRLEEVKRMAYHYQFFNQTIVRIIAGKLLGHLATNMIEFTEKEMKESEKKSEKSFFVYTTHDTELAALLSTMGVFDCDCPPYVAMVMFELYHNKADDSHFVKMLYHNSSDIDFDIDCIDEKDPKCGLHSLLETTACGENCSLEQFNSTFEHLFYDDRQKECQIELTPLIGQYSTDNSLKVMLIGLGIGFFVSVILFSGMLLTLRL